jgi:hypothetical protein
MARNLSQQAPGSRNHTPQMTNTPSMAQAMPGRQPSQTPRMMQPGSPDIGMPQNTPNGMMMQGAGQMGQNMTPEQMAILQTQRALHTGQGMVNGQNLGGNSASMTPEHIQFAQQMARFNQMFQIYQRQYQEQHAQGNLENAAKVKEQAVMVQQKIRQMKAAMAQRQQMSGNAGSPGMNMQQPTPQMGHSHPGFQQQQQQQAHQQMQQMQQMPQQGNMQDHNGMTQQQQAVIAQQQFANRNAQAQAQLNALLQKHGGQPPPQVVASLPPYLRQLLQQQTQKQHQARMQAQAQVRMQQGQHPQQQQQQQQQNGGGGVGNEQYVQHLQRMQSQLGMQMGQPQQQQQTPGGGMMPMGMNNMQQFNQQVQQQQQGQGQNDPLNAHFAAMANTLQRGGQGMQ